MGPVSATAFAFLAGLTVCGLAGSFMELATGRLLSLAAPFISPGHVVRSTCSTAIAGPFMLLNDALAWRRADRISTPLLCALAGLAGIWLLATGVVTLALASFAALHLV